MKATSTERSRCARADLYKFLGGVAATVVLAIVLAGLFSGVGADPRGGRKFNIEKQAAQYDPEGHFTAKWDGYRSAQPRYVTDAADWPI